MHILKIYKLIDNRFVSNYIFSIPVPYYLNVEIRHVINGKSISFKAESIFEPIFNMNVTSTPSAQRSDGGFPKQRSKLSLQIYYQRDSLLFQVIDF